jgi:NADH:ubiquinone oxidoreductase subunit 5 (subunit L)/multisubunit Na+/H+ antiporter MnhA subunit
MILNFWSAARQSFAVRRVADWIMLHGLVAVRRVTRAILPRHTFFPGHLHHDVACCTNLKLIIPSSRIRR